MKILLIGIVSAALVGSAARADPIVVNASAAPAAHISYADLNLASSQGRARLEGRIRAAAENLCAVLGDRTLDAYLTERTCYEAAVSSGLSQMNRAVQLQANRASAAQRAAGE